MLDSPPRRQLRSAPAIARTKWQDFPRPGSLQAAGRSPSAQPVAGTRRRVRRVVPLGDEAVCYFCVPLVAACPHYPNLKRRIEEHLSETKRQAELIEGCIKRCGGSPSAVKDTGGKMMAMMQGMGGMFTGDEIVKGAMAGYTFEHFEISAYCSLIAAAGECGDHETKRVCEQILQEEQRMASWLYDHLPSVTAQYLQREAAGVTAKR